ncbi:uncharacterized protein LOC144647905 [Oculina patagonica]
MGVAMWHTYAHHETMQHNEGNQKVKHTANFEFFSMEHSQCCLSVLLGISIHNDKEASLDVARCKSNIQLRENADGRIYDNGRARPALVRERILDLNHQGLGQRAIAREVRTSHTFVQKVITNNDVTNSSIRTPRANFPAPKIDANVLEYIEVQKRMKPSTYVSEIQNRLLLDGVIHPNDLPETSQINRRLRQDLMFSKKKLRVCQLEVEKPGAVDQQDEYLQAISRYPASKIHFFDESSVIKTTGNRRYGNARVGERAIEFQRYASNATFTINLLHSVVGVDYFNILQGPSNGLKLLNFFDDALQVERSDESAALERGDIVVIIVDFIMPITLSHCCEICSLDAELS